MVAEVAVDVEVVVAEDLVRPAEALRVVALRVVDLRVVDLQVVVPRVVDLAVLPVVDPATAE